MIPFIIFEIQTDINNTVANLPPVVKENENEAWSEYYYKLSFAAKSSVYIHTVMLCTIDGRLIQGKSFMHGEANEHSNTDTE